MRRIIAPLCAGLALVAVVACSPDEGDFATEAEDFIGDDDGEVATQTGMTFSDVQCEDPANTDTGTSFTCTATGSDGQAYLFTNQITGGREFQVLGFEPTQPGTATQSTAPAGTTPTT